LLDDCRRGRAALAELWAAGARVRPQHESARPHSRRKTDHTGRRCLYHSWAGAILNAFKIALLALCGGCAAATNDPGLDGFFRVANAQFHRGAPPATTDGPAIQAFNNSSNTIVAGQRSKPLSGLVTPDTGAIVLFLDGDPGYWIVRPGATDATQLD